MDQEAVIEKTLTRQSACTTLGVHSRFALRYQRGTELTGHGPRRWLHLSPTKLETKLSAESPWVFWPSRPPHFPLVQGFPWSVSNTRRARAYPPELLPTQLERWTDFPPRHCIAGLHHATFKVTCCAVIFGKKAGNVMGWPLSLTCQPCSYKKAL